MRTNPPLHRSADAPPSDSSTEEKPFSADDLRAARDLLFRFGLPMPPPTGEVRNFLAALAARFAALPYENISKLIQRRLHGEVGLRYPATVVEDHLAHKLGGTCFSLTYLLQALLSASGITSRRIMGHMRWGPNSHCALLADTSEGSYLLDPGYAIDRPVPLPLPGESTTVDTAYGRLTVSLRGGGRTSFDVHTERKGERKWRYSFEPENTCRKDYLHHWRESFAGPSLRQVCLYQSTPLGHLYLRKDHLRLTSRTSIMRDKVTGKVTSAIHEHFGIDPRLVESAQEALDEWRARGPLGR